MSTRQALARLNTIRVHLNRLAFLRVLEPHNFVRPERHAVLSLRFPAKFCLASYAVALDTQLKGLREIQPVGDPQAGSLEAEVTDEAGRNALSVHDRAQERGRNPISCSAIRHDVFRRDLRSRPMNGLGGSMQVPQPPRPLLSYDPCLEPRHELPELHRLVAAVSAVHGRAVCDRIIDLDLARVAGATSRDVVRYSRGHESS